MVFRAARQGFFFDSGQVAFLGGKSRSLGIHDQMCHHLKYSNSFEDFPVTGTKIVSTMGKSS